VAVPNAIAVAMAQLMGTRAYVCLLTRLKALVSLGKKCGVYVPGSGTWQGAMRPAFTVIGDEVTGLVRQRCATDWESSIELRRA
jgi:hypothetical protein